MSRHLMEPDPNLPPPNFRALLLPFLWGVVAVLVAVVLVRAVAVPLLWGIAIALGIFVAALA